MKSFLFILFSIPVLLISTAAFAESPEDRYFPSISEFQEIQDIASEKSFDDPSNLARIPDGMIISAVGFRHYARRDYHLPESRSLSIEVLTLLDFKAAYSLLTLSGNSNIQPGPPGDEYSFDADGIQFAHGNHWVNIRSKGAAKEFISKVAEAVSLKLGSLHKKMPELISHFPKKGFNESSLLYFPSFKTFEAYKKAPSWIQTCGQDMEIGQAKYSIGDKTGVLSLLSFPTSEIAEVCYSKLASINANRIYHKKIGPIIGVFEGSIDAQSAGKLLEDIHYDYSVQWIYEKKESKATNIFGIPVHALDGLIKKSFFLVGLILLLSIGGGLACAIFRFRFRNRVSKSNKDDGDITHLRMR